VLGVQCLATYGDDVIVTDINNPLGVTACREITYIGDAKGEGCRCLTG
jgi:hypothetical protein